MLRKIFSYFTLPLLLLLSNSSGNSAPQSAAKSPGGETGTLEKLIVASGNVVMDLDLNRLAGSGSGAQQSKPESVRFDVGPNSFFTVLVFNNALRGPDVGSMGLIWGNSRVLPEPLNSSANQLVIEKLPSDAGFDLAVRDGKTGFVFFNIEGHEYEYAAAAFTRHQERKASDFRRTGQKAGAACGRWCGDRECLDLYNHVSDRNHDGRQRREPIVRPARSTWTRGSEFCERPGCYRGRFAFHGAIGKRGNSGWPGGGNDFL
jgi:hypothetical protein